MTERVRVSEELANLTIHTHVPEFFLKSNLKCEVRPTGCCSKSIFGSSSVAGHEPVHKNSAKILCITPYVTGNIN